MSICTTCGAQLPAQARFCGICGAPLHPLPSPNDLPPGLVAVQRVPPMHVIADMKTRPPLPISASTAFYSRPVSGHLVPDHAQQPGSMSAQMHPAYHTKAPMRTTRKPASGWLALGIIALVVAITVASGIMAYMLTRPYPQPVISVASGYTVGTNPAGAQGTTLHIRGQKFSSNSAITFLLDGHIAPGTPRVASDHNGNLSVNLPIPAAWSPGRHLLNARDAAHYSSKKDVVIEVVLPGQANTPGPNGAPPDDASFSMHISQNTPIQEQYNGSNGQLSNADPLVVTGHADPAGGSVCKARDNGQPQTYNGTTADGLSDTQVATFSCTGTYKGGRVSYTETLLSDIVTVSYQGDSYVCHLLTSSVNEQLSGSYTASGNFSGTITYSSFPQSDFSCTTGQLAYFNFSLAGGTGTWTATDTPS